jgi:AbrB family looped-hinge helix DNA binding protein
MVDAMRTTIDKAGRLVIPRALRDRIGLAGGGEVELELDGAAVRIQPVSGSDLKDVAGLLVIPTTGTPLTGVLVRELIEADRHGRDRGSRYRRERRDRLIVEDHEAHVAALEVVQGRRLGRPGTPGLRRTRS